MQNYKEVAHAAAHWWADKSFNDPDNQNNGTDDLAMLLKKQFAAEAQNKVTDFQKEKFTKLLTECLESVLKLEDSRAMLDVDYHPCELLSDVCKAAKVDEQCLPIKTDMWIETDGDITVSYGYRGSIENLVVPTYKPPVQ
jgi:hypothetical protein